MQEAAREAKLNRDAAIKEAKALRRTQTLRRERKDILRRAQKGEAMLNNAGTSRKS